MRARPTTTNVNDKVDLDWDNLQLVNPQGAEAKTIANMWDTGVKLQWKINGAVMAGDFVTYDATVAEANTGQSILCPTAERSFDVRSATGVVVGCGTWRTDGNVTVVFNENANSAAEWAGSVTTSAMIQDTGEARTVKEGWIGLSDSEDGDENKSIM